MSTSIPWSLEEIHALRVAFERNPCISTAEIRALLPNRTLKAIWSKCRVLGISRPPHYKRRCPAWEPIAKMLKDGPKTRRYITNALGCTEANVRGILDRKKGSWHVAGWDGLSPKIGLGAGADVPYPLNYESQSERMKRYRLNQKAKKARQLMQPTKVIVQRDPLTAAFFGAAAVPASLAALPSRVFKQAMTNDDELEQAA